MSQSISYLWGIKAMSKSHSHDIAWQYASETQSGAFEYPQQLSCIQPIPFENCTILHRSCLLSTTGHMPNLSKISPGTPADIIDQIMDMYCYLSCRMRQCFKLNLLGNFSKGIIVLLQ